MNGSRMVTDICMYKGARKQHADAWHYPSKSGCRTNTKDAQDCALPPALEEIHVTQLGIDGFAVHDHCIGRVAINMTALTCPVMLNCCTHEPMLPISTSQGT